MAHGPGDPLEDFFAPHTHLCFRKGAIVLRPHETLRGIHYLKKGLVQQYVISQKGEVLIIHTFRPGSFFPMFWAVSDTPISYYYEAISPVEIYRAPREEVVDFVRAHPDVLYNFAIRLLRGLQGLSVRLESLVMTPARNRIISLFLYLAKVFGSKVRRGVLIDLPLTHKEIASWIGTTRETASIEVKKLEKEKLITARHHRFFIPELSRLEKELTY